MRTILESVWGALQIGIQLVLGPALHRWRIRWGADDDEIRRPLPGDELVPDPRWSYTHAITIRAPRSAIWPWLVQIGQGRGGFFSYEGLENLVGCDIHNVLELRAELQRLELGDTVTRASSAGPRRPRQAPRRAVPRGADQLRDEPEDAAHDPGAR